MDQNKDFMQILLPLLAIVKGKPISEADKEAIAEMVNEGFTETVSGSTPTVTAEANTLYICGEVSTLSFTPCGTGTCEIIFESGATPTVLTVPNTVQFPEWFDATSLQANTTYDISVSNGVYGAVMAWS